MTGPTDRGKVRIVGAGRGLREHHRVRELRTFDGYRARDPFASST